MTVCVAHGWVEGIPSHGNVLLSRGRLILLQAPRDSGHLSFIQLDFFYVLFLYLMQLLITRKKGSLSPVEKPTSTVFIMNKENRQAK